MKVDLIIAIMAVQEAEFFAIAAKRLKSDGVSVAFLNFHEAADDICDREGVKYFSLHKIKRGLPKTAPGDAEVKDVEQRLGIAMDRVALHEKLTANRSQDYTTRKFVAYHDIIDSIFRDNEIGCVLQELGGFMAPQMLYHVTRARGVNHVFIEPAMFPRRLVYTLNTMYAGIPARFRQAASNAMPVELKSLIEKYTSEKTVVIPKKDRHFFKDMNLSRLLSPDNFKRLSRKLYHKYILGRQEEYDAILWYAVYHVQKMLKRKSLTAYYTQPDYSTRYVYYPFHVPLDVQLTVRCPEYLDQESVVDKIASELPEGHMLYIKEHPAAIGGHDFKRLTELLKNRKNVRLIHPLTNSFDLIKNSACVVTINSKVGFEAIMQSKPVVVLGKAFYRGHGVTVDADGIADVKRAIKTAIESFAPDGNIRTAFLNSAFAWSLEGELYEFSPANVDKYCESLNKYLTEEGLITVPAKAAA